MVIVSLPKVFQSKAIYGNKEPLKSFKLTVLFTGTISFFYGVSSSPINPPTTWFEVTGLVSGFEKLVTITGGGGEWLYYRIVLSPGAVLSTAKDLYGRFTAPAIRIRDITSG